MLQSVTPETTPAHHEFIQPHEHYEKPSPLSKSQRRQANKAVARAQKEQQAIANRLVGLNESQDIYLEILRDPNVSQVFAVGEAGTGKTYIPSRIAARRLVDKQISKIFIARPTVSSPAHKLGFLPGKMNAKLEPWLIPIMDAFKVEMSAQMLAKYMGSGEIEFISFEHLRGRTLADAFVILDEAQNCTIHDLKLFLTRKGEGSTYVIAGDPTQTDIGNSGLIPILDMIEEYDLSPSIVEFDPEDVVRSRDAKEWVTAFRRRTDEEQTAAEIDRKTRQAEQAAFRAGSEPSTNK
jgi:phosphate starvation-inducible PhoH-like protein